MNNELSISQSAMEHLIQDRAPVVVSSKELKFSFASYILSVEKKNIYLKNTVPLDYIHEVIYKENFTMGIADWCYHTKNLKGDGVNFVFTVEDVQSLTSMRRFRRSDLTSSNTALVEYVNPLDHKTRFRKKIVSLSVGGLSFETNFPSLLFCKNQEFRDVKILINNQVQNKKGFRVVYCKRFFNLESKVKYQVGAEFL